MSRKIDKKNPPERARKAAREAAEKELLDAAEIALKRLIHLGAEDEIETYGPCPACEALRVAIKKATTITYP